MNDRRVESEVVRKRLGRLLNDMPASRLVLLERIALAMGRQLETEAVTTDDLFDQALIDAIGDQLLLHHGTHDEPVSKKPFEYVFRNAATATGREAVINLQTTDAAEDVQVDGVGFSLKSEAAKSQSKTGINIQKLMEARWIRDCPGPAELAEKARTLIPAHLERYERILLLRGKRTSEAVEYVLYEIPKSVLLMTEHLTAADFEPKNKYGGSAADVYDGDVRVFRLRLDGSVEKVRVFTLRIDYCITRARWRVPLGVASVA